MHWQNKSLLLALCLTATVFAAGCSAETTDSSDLTPSFDTTRAFYMGFTPWNYGIDLASYEDTYAKINANGDIIAHHLQTGIPWQEAYDETAYPSQVDADITDRLSYSESGKVIYLAIDSLNGTRDEMAPYWGSSFNEPLSEHPPWDTRDFTSAEVIQAFTNFALEMITRFNPAYFNYAPEISELIINDASKYAQFKTFAAALYANIKAVHPDLPILISIAFKNPASVNTTIIQTRIAEISDYYDMLGISTYGYIFFDLYGPGGDPENLPTTWLSQAQDIAGSKPLAITETAWIAEDYPLGEPYNFTITASAQNQDDYLRKMFEESNALDMEFIIWFSIVDYDTWDATYGNPATRIWRDTGLIDGSLVERPGRTTWQSWLAKIRH